jgi:hypothetical protein
MKLQLMGICSFEKVTTLAEIAPMGGGRMGAHLILEDEGAIQARDFFLCDRPARKGCLASECTCIESKYGATNKNDGL